MKKIWSIILSLIIMASLVGCSDSSSDEVNVNTYTTEYTTNFHEINVETYTTEYATTTEPITEDPFEGCVEYCDAAEYVGEEITVYGEVYNTYYAVNSNGSPTFINIGAPYGDLSRCTVVIWDEDRSKFQSPESLYDGKKIKVTGTVEMYEGAAQIMASSPSQIEIIE